MKSGVRFGVHEVKVRGGPQIHCETMKTSEARGELQNEIVLRRLYTNGRHGLVQAPCRKKEKRDVCYRGQKEARTASNDDKQSGREDRECGDRTSAFHFVTEPEAVYPPGRRKQAWLGERDGRRRGGYTGVGLSRFAEACLRAEYRRPGWPGRECDWRGGEFGDGIWEGGGAGWDGVVGAEGAAARAKGRKGCCGQRGSAAAEGQPFWRGGLERCAVHAGLRMLGGGARAGGTRSSRSKAGRPQCGQIGRWGGGACAGSELSGAAAAVWASMPSAARAC